MSEVNDRYIRAKIKGNLIVFEEIEKFKKKFFEKNPDKDSVEITLKSKSTGEMMKITLLRN